MNEQIYKSTIEPKAEESDTRINSEDMNSGEQRFNASSFGKSFFGTGIPENCTKEERKIYGTPGCGKSFSVKHVKSHSN